MTSEILTVDAELRLRPFAGDADVDAAWTWYRDPETVALVDGLGAPPYARDRVAALYDALAGQGDVLMNERLTPSGWVVVGEATLAPDTLPIVIAPEHRAQGIGRRVLLRLVDRARVLGWTELRVREVLPGNEASHGLFRSLGFVPRDDGPQAYVLPLAPLGGRPRV
jgi:GNAT superfamily N-acetyltransferase